LVYLDPAEGHSEEFQNIEIPSDTTPIPAQTSITTDDTSAAIELTSKLHFISIKVNNRYF
jgi:hypothetical protein